MVNNTFYRKITNRTVYGKMKSKVGLKEVTIKTTQKCIKLNIHEKLPVMIFLQIYQQSILLSRNYISKIISFP